MGFKRNGKWHKRNFINTIGEIANDLDIFMQLQDFEEIKNYNLIIQTAVTAISRVAVKRA
ncbi:MAG: hypothetical protein R2837_09595 [Aliarcobacter sp.]